MYLHYLNSIIIIIISNDDVIKYNIFEDAVGEIENCGFLKIS